jgi:hypothetical protein
MSRSRFIVALLTSFAGLAFSSGTAISAQENDVALAQATAAQSTDFSAQGRRGFGGNPRVGRVGNVGRVGRVGNVGRVGRVGHQGRIGRVGRVGHQGRIGRVGRIGYRYGRIGRVGRIGYVPVPVPLPVGPGPAGPRLVAPTCPVCPVQACLIAIYAEPNLTGMTVETPENQPRLDQSGWQNQISSVIVKGGTWEFYPDIEYRAGPPLRLVPGSYPVLEPQWTKRIGSFMCVR